MNLSNPEDRNLLSNGLGESLKNDILPAIQQFTLDIKFVPSQFISDCNKKLFGRKVQKWLNKHNSSVIHTPSGRQRQNGLCERNWRTILRMARGWIASHQLLATFWWHAIKRAVEVSNYIPIKIDDTITTPHKLVHGTKPDLRCLLPMFSVAYI